MIKRLSDNLKSKDNEVVEEKKEVKRLQVELKDVLSEKDEERKRLQREVLHRREST